MSVGIVFVSQQLQALQTAVLCPLAELHFEHASNPFAVTNYFCSGETRSGGVGFHREVHIGGKWASPLPRCAASTITSSTVAT